MYLKSITSRYPIKIRTGDIILVNGSYYRITSINEKQNTGTARNSKSDITFTKFNAKFKRRDTK